MGQQQKQKGLAQPKHPPGTTKTDRLFRLMTLESAATALDQADVGPGTTATACGSFAGVGKRPAVGISGGWDEPTGLFKRVRGQFGQKQGPTTSRGACSPRGSAGSGVGLVLNGLQSSAGKHGFSKNL